MCVVIHDHFVLVLDIALCSQTVGQVLAGVALCQHRKSEEPRSSTGGCCFRLMRVQRPQGSCESVRQRRQRAGGSPGRRALLSLAASYFLCEQKSVQQAPRARLPDRFSWQSTRLEEMAK
jgi:hypothetical protein